MYYNMLNNNNLIVQQMIQHDKETYMANKILHILYSEDLTNVEIDRIINMVKKRMV